MKTFRQAVRTDDFVVTAQLPPAPMTTADDIRATVDALRPCVDALQISDNVPRSRTGWRSLQRAIAVEWRS